MEQEIDSRYKALADALEKADDKVQSQSSTITHLESQQKHDLDKLAKAEKRVEELEGGLKSVKEFLSDVGFDSDENLVTIIDSLLKGDTP